MRAPHKNLIAILFWSASFYLGKIVGSNFAFQNNVENFCVVANRSLRFTGGCGLGLHPLLFYGGIVMKKLKTWQKVLLIIFYPVGIVYFIVWLCKRNKGATPAPVANESKYDFDIVFVNKGSKVYHCDQMCAMSRGVDCSEMKEKDAIKRGLRRCGKCYGNYN